MNDQKPTKRRVLARGTSVLFYEAGEDRSGLYRVTTERLDENGTAVERLAFVCDRLILAAGVHRPRILLTARETGALPRLHESVGRAGDPTVII